MENNGLKRTSRVLATMNGVEGVDGTPGISGGDIRLIKVVSLLSDRLRFTTSVTPTGKRLLDLYAVPGGTHVLRTSDVPGIRGNVERVLKSMLPVPGEPYDLVYSGGEHLYDVLPALRSRLINKTPWLALVHWVEEYPWRDKRGGTPILHRYLYWLNRIVAMALIRRFANHVLAVSASTRHKLVHRRGFSSEKVSTVFCGLDLPFAMSVRETAEPKIYDAVFMKRLNFGKGVRDLIDIWALVVREKPDARLQIIGHGPPDVVHEIEQRVKDLGIEANVTLVGVVHDPDEKRRRLAQSRLFVLPSHEENWAIVIGEALAAGLPVVAYDLKEIRPLWGERVSWVPFADIPAFAAAILQALQSNQVPNIDDFLRSLDWTAIAQTDFEHMQRLLQQ